MFAEVTSEDIRRSTALLKQVEGSAVQDCSGRGGHIARADGAQAEQIFMQDSDCFCAHLLDSLARTDDGDSRS